MHTRQCAVLVVAVIMLGWMSRAEENPKVAIIKADAPPVIDGILNDPCWQKAAILPDFKIIYPAAKRGGTPSNRTAVKLLFDDNFIYIGVEAFDPEPDKVCTNACVKRDGAWGDDCMEIFIAPDGGAKYYQWIINAAGRIVDIDFSNPKKGDNTWDSNILACTGKAKAGWILEAKIPVAELGVTSKTTSAWKFNISRWEPRLMGGQSWGTVYGYDPVKCGNLEGMDLNYADYVYEVENIDWGSCGLGKDWIEMKVKNTAGADKKAAGILTLECEGALKGTGSNTLALAGGGNGALKIDYEIGAAGGSGKMNVALADAGNGKTVWLKTKYFDISAEPVAVKPDKKDYYLSDRVANVSLEFAMGRETMRTAGANVTITDESGKEVFNRKTEKMTNNPVVVPVDISGFKAGSYRIQAVIFDNGNRKVCSGEGKMSKIKGPFDE